MASGISPILLVEDDDILAGLLVEFLGTLGEVVRSASAEDAEARLGSRPWDLIVADVELPGATGIDVIERATTLHPLCSKLIAPGAARSTTRSAPFGREPTTTWSSPWTPRR